MKPQLTKVLLALLLAAVPCASFGAFGLTTATDYYTVDTGAGLVFKVRRTDNGSSTQSAGDLMSLVYNGIEYQNQSRGSQINSGFDFLYTGVSAVTVSASVINVNYIRITVQAGNLTHYYMARNGYPNIYMATHFTTEPDTLGLCRYIVRIPSDLLSNGPVASDIRNNTGAIESGDIFGMADGTTRSKHYSNMRLMDWSFIGATGTNVGVFMLRSNHEGDSGGPFYRSLLNQCGSDQEITYIINYGEGQTEPFRTNVLNGPYALVFTGGGQPGTNLDYSWIETNGFNLTGWVSNANRGAVSGSVAGVPTGFQPVVGFANGQAQYWTVPATNGSYTSPLMIPGTYTMTLYKQELVVAMTNVTVTAGTTNTSNLASAEASPTYIWKLGEWDGTPAGFLNAGKVTTMHPSDIRMSNWNPGTFVVGASTVPSGIPCYQWKDVNGSQVIQFNLTAAQVVASTVRVGITVAYEGARPKISVNSWTYPSNPSPSTQPATRTLTVGTYRGNNVTYSFAVPASALVVGLNTLTVFPISGSGATTFLSAGYSLDCIEWDGPAVSPPTTPTGLTATAGNLQVGLNWDSSPGATSYNIKRATVSGGPFVTIASGVKPPTYTDASLVNGTAYYYVVSAVNSMGESSDSSSASATPFDLYAYWKFDESSGLIADDFAGTNNGVLASASAVWVTGKTNNAMKLNGTANSYVSFPTGLVSALNDFSIATWVKVDTNALWARIFDFGTGTGNYMFLAPVSFSSNTVRYAITTSSGGGEQQINTTATLSTGVWHHVGVTLSGNTGVLYLDGAAVGTNNSMTLRPSTLGTTTQNYLGKSQWPDPNLNGSIDDFRIYNRALSAAEITALFTPPALPAAPTGLLATTGGAQINLSWNPSAGAASYLVKRSPVSGGPYTTVAAGVTSTSYSDSGVFGGSNYFYVVSAMNATGEGTNSSEASATPFDFYGYWKFDETSGTNAADVAGAHNGTLAATATWGAGKTNNGVKLNGTTNSYVSFPTGLFSTLNDFSIATWVKVDTNATWARIFDFGSGTGNYMFLAPASGGNTVRYAIIAAGGGGEQQINSAAILSTGVWHHVAVTLSGTTGTLYIDGAVAGSTNGMTLRPSILGNTTQNYLGKSQWPDPNLIGTIDEFRIYNRALSGTEVSALASPPSAAPTGFAATPGNNQVSLSWNVSSGATSYKIKRATISGGPYSTIASPAATSYTDSTAVNGTTYYYVVSSVNLGGEGSNSAQVVATLTSIAPVNLSVSLSGDTFNLSWPMDHTGWRLQVQTNNLATGLATNWFDVVGSATTNGMTSPVDVNTGSMFYRLVY